MSAANKLRGLIVLALACGLLGGCGAAILRVEDTAALPGRKTFFTAYVEREAPFGLGKDIEHLPVRFQWDGQTIADTRSGSGGQAFCEYLLKETSPAQFEVQATVDGKPLQATGTIFHWQPDHPAIAIDVDHTVAQTDVESLILGTQGELSTPVADSAETLRTLAKDFQILYVTARSRSFLDKTRDWLNKNEFPAGPVIVAPRFSDMVRREQYKRRIFSELRTRWPNLLIGISNSRGDMIAYATNHMLPLLVRPDPKEHYPTRAVMLVDWRLLGEFFAANREALLDPEKLNEILAGKRMLSQPLPP